MTSKNGTRWFVWGVAALAAARFIMWGRQMAQNRKEDIDLIARTIWGEAWVVGYDGMAAVANVINNRVRRGGWWGATYKDVILKPYQFSIWNARTTDKYANDPAFVSALDKIEGVTTATPSFAEAVRIATAAYDGTLTDNTGGATHYKRSDVSAAWADGLSPIASIGHHDFYITA